MRIYGIFFLRFSSEEKVDHGLRTNTMALLYRLIGGKRLDVIKKFEKYTGHCELTRKEDIQLHHSHKNYLTHYAVFI